MFYSILGHYLLAIIIMSFGAAFAQEQTGDAPECRVGQKLNFRYDDGRSFTRDDEREQAWEEVKQKLRRFEGPNGCELPGELLIGIGTK